MEISRLKDVIFRTGKYQWDDADINGSFKDIKGVYNKISNWKSASLGESKLRQSQEQAFQHAYDCFTELYDVFEDYEENVRSK